MGGPGGESPLGTWSQAARRPSLADHPARHDRAISEAIPQSVHGFSEGAFTLSLEASLIPEQSQLRGIGARQEVRQPHP